MKYADIILPLAVSQTYTYRIPAPLASKLTQGMSVVVPFGKRKYYTGIVHALRDVPPEGDFALKDITETIQEKPLVYSEQITFWEWMSNYYMCSLGEVMKAALPAGLKLESEMKIFRNPNFSDDEELSPTERSVLSFLEDGKPVSVGMLEKKMGKNNLLSPIRKMILKDILCVEEHLKAVFKPKKETHVKLTKEYFDKEKLKRLSEELTLRQKQKSLLSAYCRLSAVSTALTLGNASLLKEVSKKELMEAAGVTDSVLQTLRKKSVFELYSYQVGRVKMGETLSDILLKDLSPLQATALSRVEEVFLKKEVCLLRGVTSSGKTEVYTHLINKVIKEGKQVLYLLPEIALTTQMMQRLKRTFGHYLGVYHSKFPDNERVEFWQKQLSASPFQLVLGVRSSLFLPYQNLGLIIVDEEHETSYKQQDPAPRYNARDMALVLAKIHHAKTLLGTATPSLETYYKAKLGKYGLVEMLKRFSDVDLPEIVVEDIGELRKKRLMRTPISPRLEIEMKGALNKHEQIILFQNRRGYAPVVQCELCGWVPRCETCDVSLTYHQTQHVLACHYCGRIYALPSTCPKCNHSQLKDIGCGTEKIETFIHQKFPDIRTGRMDLDTTRSRKGYDKILSDFGKGETNVLIGTQMITKGLDFSKVHVVGILNADQMLNSSDFRAYERSFQMMSQVAGRAGRGGRRGVVVLQTKQPDLEVVKDIVNHDYERLYYAEMLERREYMFPPFVRLINIYFKHRNEMIAARAAATYSDWIKPYFKNCLLGPDKPLVSRVQLLHIRKLMLKVANDFSLAGIRGTLLSAKDNLLSVDEFKSVTLYFDVDPY